MRSKIIRNARHVLQVIRLAVTAIETGEYAKDLGAALGAHYCVGGLETPGIECASASPGRPGNSQGAVARGQGDIDPGVLQQ